MELKDMGSGHASHKGKVAKPNTNANNLADTAADATIDPQDLLGELGEATRKGEQIIDNPAATERPAKP